SREGTRATHAAGADHHDAAAAAAAARVGDRARVVERARAAPRPGRDARRGGRESSAAKPAHRKVRVPGVAAHTAPAPVRPAATAGVLVVRGWMRIGATAARGTRGAARP